MKLTAIAVAVVTMGLAGFTQDPPPAYKVITVVESIVPGGVSRSNGTDSQQGKIERRDQHIASNDVLIGAKINELAKNGWKLLCVTSGVDSHAGAQDDEGIFITRLIFSKN